MVMIIDNSQFAGMAVIKGAGLILLIVFLIDISFLVSGHGKWPDTRDN
jgi:hypothetical protein